MAYLDTRDHFVPTARVPLDVIEARFDRREWSVIVLARDDGLTSLRPPTGFARLMKRLFGGVDRRLADPRLEALRRFAVLAWHYGYTVPASAMRAFKEAGYTLDHIEVLLASVAAARVRRHQRVAA